MFRCTTCGGLMTSWQDYIDIDLLCTSCGRTPTITRGAPAFTGVRTYNSSNPMHYDLPSNYGTVPPSAEDCPDCLYRPPNHHPKCFNS